MKSEPLANAKIKKSEPPQLLYNGKKQGSGMVVYLNIDDSSTSSKQSLIVLYSEQEQYIVGDIWDKKDIAELKYYEGEVKLSN